MVKLSPAVNWRAGMELSIEHLTKNYGSFVALCDISVSFCEGVYGLLGVNGAGKSTLINLITDNIPRNKENGGTIKLDGQDILALGKEYRSVVGYMPQQQGFYDEMTPVMFLKYMGALKGIGGRQLKPQLEYLLKRVNLWNVRYKRIGSFSGGMKQRVMLAQALLGEPKLLILDEPTAGLDPKERVNLRKFISELSKEKIVIYATHVVSDIESIADKVMIISDGQLMYFDAPQAIEAAMQSEAQENGSDIVISNLEDAFMYANGNAGGGEEP